MKTTLPPRACYLTEQLTREAQRPPAFDPLLVCSLPDDVTSLTGGILSVAPMKEGGPTLALLLEAERGAFVLKVAAGAYRSQEFWAEHTALQLAHRAGLPVPEPLRLTKRGNLSFQLRRHVAGEPLSSILTDESSDADAIQQMGELLASIHATGPVPAWTWDDWISASLKLAAGNLAAGVCDPDEFTADQRASAALDWLLANRPGRSGPVCLLHGDFRPKNVLWANGKIAGVVDWQFVDYGDPCYDLSVIHWYLRDEAEWQQFLDGYGASDWDDERLAYCLVLQKFLNV